MGGPELPPLAGGASSRDPSPTRASPRGVAAPDESKLLPEIKSRASGYATAVPDNSREDAAQQQKKMNTLQLTLTVDGKTMTLSEAMQQKPPGLYLEMLKGSLDVTPRGSARSSASPTGGSHTSRPAGDAASERATALLSMGQGGGNSSRHVAAATPRKSYLNSFDVAGSPSMRDSSPGVGRAEGSSLRTASPQTPRASTGTQTPHAATARTTTTLSRTSARDAWAGGSEEDGLGGAALVPRPPAMERPSHPSWVTSCKRGSKLARRSRRDQTSDPFKQNLNASNCFCEALAYDPQNDWLRKGYEASYNRFKTDQVTRWAKWPFHIPEAPRMAAREKKQPLEPPDSMYGHLHGAGCTDHSVDVRWDEHELRHANDRIAGYELEAAEISFLDGLQPFAQVYKGSNLQFTVGGLLAEQQVVLRVRAYNRKGQGEWSEELTLQSSEEVEKELVEITEIPPTWHHLDIMDICGEDPNGNKYTMEDVMYELTETLTDHQKAIKIAFRYFALTGASNTTEEICDAMGQQQFVAFAKTAKLLDKKLIVSDCDRLYVRATRVTENVLNAFGSSPSKALRKMAKGMAKAGNMMYQHQFVAALFRLCAIKWPDLPSHSHRFDKLMNEHVNDMVYNDLQLLSDDFSKRMGGPVFKAVLRKHEEKLATIFNFYSGADKKLAASGMNSTMNIKETGELCEDAGFFDTTYGVRDLVASFVKVNIDDELYVQEDEDNNSAELVYDEFEEVVARMYNLREFSRLPAAEQNEPNALENGFDAWLENYFVPMGMGALKLRKKSNR